MTAGQVSVASCEETRASAGLTAAGRGRDGQGRYFRGRGSVRQVGADWTQREVKRQQRRRGGRGRSSQGAVYSVPHAFVGCLGLAGWFFCWPPLEPGAVRWQLGLEAHLGWKSKMASPSHVWCLIAPSMASLPTCHLVLQVLSLQQGHQTSRMVASFQEHKAKPARCPYSFSPALALHSVK